MIKRLVFGFFAALPIIMVALVILVMSRIEGFWPNWFWYGFPILFLVGLVAYIWDVWHNSAVPEEKRKLWTALLFFGNAYVLPFYFAFYIWPRSDGSKSPS